MIHVRHFVSVTVLLSLEHEMYFWKTWLLASKTWIEVADNVTKVNKKTMSMSLIGHFLASKFQNSHFQDEATCWTFLVKMSFICMRIKNRFLEIADKGDGFDHAIFFYMKTNLWTVFSELLKIFFKNCNTSVM